MRYLGALAVLTVLTLSLSVCPCVWYLYNLHAFHKSASPVASHTTPTRPTGATVQYSTVQYKQTRSTDNHPIPSHPPLAARPIIHLSASASTTAGSLTHPAHSPSSPSPPSPASCQSQRYARACLCLFTRSTTSYSPHNKPVPALVTTSTSIHPTDRKSVV